MTDPTPQTTPTRDEAGDFLHRLRAANIRRDAEYRAKTQGEPLPLLFRTTEFAGEVGELLNVVKKIERERLGWAGKRADRQMLLEEFGGVVATLDLLAMMLDIDLAAATADEFNAVSDRLSLTTKLASAPATASGGVDAVAVKPLEWSIGVEPNMWFGDGLFGARWQIVNHVHFGPANFEARFDDEDSGALAWCSTLDEAKAAAQADYETRIRSALEVSQ